MNSLHVSLVIFLLIFAGAVTGILLRRALPEEHLSPAGEASIKLVTGFVVTMTGIILGMLVSSAKSSYDGQKLLVAQLASEVILLDRAMADYGPTISPIRSTLSETVEAAANRVWSAKGATHLSLQPKDRMDQLEADLNRLAPTDNNQAYAKSHSIAILGQVQQSSWLLFLESDTNRLSMPLLVILVAWIVAIFISFGLFAPPNPTVIATILIGALAVSAAILIIMEMYSPFSGLMKISEDPIRQAILRLKHGN